MKNNINTGNFEVKCEPKKIRSKINCIKKSNLLNDLSVK